mgnify:CR=1 FL=1
MTDALTRIAEALERLAPAPMPAPDFTAAEAFAWHTAPDRLEPVVRVSRVDIGLLIGINRSRDTLLENTRHFAAGLPANNALLWGARGMGKSSLVKAVHAAVRAEGHDLKIVELSREDLPSVGRLLAHLHQGAFYQRLRSELQLGYAVFCSYRQIQGRRGLLFGVQSPGCKAAEILQHIQAFLQARSAWLAGLDQAALAASITALRGQWQVQARSCDGLAEQAWLAHLAGLADAHCEAVQQALQSLSLEAVQQAQQTLLEASAGWYVLSNEPAPAHI